MPFLPSHYPHSPVPRPGDTQMGHHKPGPPSTRLPTKHTRSRRPSAARASRASAAAPNLQTQHYWEIIGNINNEAISARKNTISDQTLLHRTFSSRFQRCFMRCITWCFSFTKTQFIFMQNIFFMSKTFKQVSLWKSQVCPYFGLAV